MIVGGTRPLNLTVDDAALIDGLKKAEAAVRKFAKAKRDHRRLKQKVDALFGAHQVAVLQAMKPEDKRVFLRTVETRDYDPLPEKTVKISQIHEVPPWDL